MPNILTLSVPNPDQILNVGAYGAGAVIQVQSGALEAGPFADDGTVAIVSGTTSYTYFDSDGVTATWYRTRYENAAGAVVSDWSATFQPDQSSALANYVTLADLKARLGAGITAASDAVLTQICNETNQWIESYTGRVMGPVPSAVYLFDGSDAPNSQTLDVYRYGVRAVSLLELASQTGGSYSTMAATEYFLRPTPTSQYPATRIYLNTGQRFSSGYDTIRVTMTAGFPVVPDDVRAVAINIATRAWHGRQSGMADVVGSTETGAPIVTKIIAPEFKATLDRYRPALVA
ncbi:MAG: hypothetical protein M3N43_14700 [Actinomycetota bacterium]|nr:hypothetical protein [Actinomycetota bacterium]